MQITEEKIDDLNLVLNVEIKNDDYREQLDKSVKSYAKKANIPGFRPGKVPAGIIRKKYGKALLADELYKIIQDSLDNYIKEHKLNILGIPLPDDNQTEPGDWDNPGDFVFKYDVGLAPDFEIKLDKRIKQDYLVIEVEDKMIEDHILNLRKRNGELKNVEQSSEEDILVVDLVELDENDEIREGGIMHQATVYLDFIDDEETKKKLTGLKPGDHVIVDPRKLTREGDEELARMLGVDKSELDKIQSNFRVDVKEVKTFAPAELNEEFFNKMGEPGEIKSVEDLKEKIKSDTEKQFARESDRLFYSKMRKYLIEKAAIELPDGFLKRYIKATNENPITDEQLESEYDLYADSLKWQLIENKLMEQAGIKVEENDLLEKARQFIAEQYMQYGLPVPDVEMLNHHARQMLSDEKESRRIIDIVVEEKMIDYLKGAVKLNEKTVSYDDFIKAVTEI